MDSTWRCDSVQHEPAKREQTSPVDLENGYNRLNLIGESPAFHDSLRLIRRMANCDATVLILGETGTGKEVAARAIHYLGSRRGFPFVPVNCGAIPDSLIENEFFGHVQGAFTDAKCSRPGVIAQAMGGTLFLDEIEALNLKGQVTLLRFLQDCEYRPIGSTATFNADVRIISASNANLQDLVNQGAYRRDLLFRLNVLSLDMPRLRERGNDIILLANYFIQRFSRQYCKPEKVLHPTTVYTLLQYDWPGNVRELENLIHREFLLSDGEYIELRDLSRRVQAATPPQNPNCTVKGICFQEAKARAIAKFERAYINELLSRTQGNISLAARLSGKDRSSLGKLVKKYGLERTGYTFAKRAV